MTGYEYLSFLAKINKLLSPDVISYERESFIYSTSELNDGFTEILQMQ